MSTHDPREPLAIRIADALLQKDSLAALRRAEAMREAARRRNNNARSDLFAAVCAIICWRDQLIGRMKLPAGDRR